MKREFLPIAIGVSALLLFAQAAGAHPGHGSQSGFITGIAHPLSGLDHILAMIAVGLCAAQMGRRGLWLLPASFLACMFAGGALGVGAGNVLMTEHAIISSVIVLGLIVATGSRLSLPWTAALVGLFGAFHGYAHGAEMQAGVGPIAYAMGFVVATAALHALGMGAGLLLKQRGTAPALRFAGGAITACGLLMVAGLI